MNSMLANLKVIAPYLYKSKPRKFHFYIVATFILILGTIGINLLVPILLKENVNHLSNNHPLNNQTTMILLLAYGVCWLFGRLMEEFREIAFFSPMSRAITDYSLDVFKHIHAQSLQYHLNRETGKVSGAIQRSQLAFSMLVKNLIFRIVPVFIEILLALIIIGIFVSYKISIVVLCTLVFYIIMNNLIINIYKRSEAVYQQINTDVDKRVIDSLFNSETIKYFGASAIEADIVNKLLWKREESIVSVFWAGTYSTIIHAIILGSGLMVASFMVAQDVLAGQLEVGDFILVNGYLIFLFNPLETMTGLIRSAISHSAQVSHSVDILAQEQMIVDTEGALELKLNNAKVEFKDVCFQYSPDRKILNNISFIVPVKSSLAIVGSTGSGKSTIGRLIYRFYDINAGQILLDEQDIKQVTKNSLRKTIATVPQDIALLNKSLRYNIAYGNFNASEEEIAAVIQQVKLTKLVEKLPHGLDTIVGERGIKLSGGEKQRIAIARALLKKPKVIVFDEATSSLDNQTEFEIQQNIEEITKDITTITIAHRLSTVVNADNILVLEQGHIIEQGTHASLMQQDGTYKQLWDSQHEK